MNFKKAIFTGLILLVTTFSFGQSTLEKMKKLPAEDVAKQRTEIMDKKLDLTDEQEVKVQEINLESSKKRKEIFQNTSRFKIPRKLKVVKADYDEKLEKILSPEQFKLYEDKKGEIKDEMIFWVDEQEI
ncbi:hypothetical protein [Aureivirga marina]|uniref:hypothetical protein n=1 Tax=Aureivirga marina TaxID=1182451 RepID=UPI0018C93548|nr:hypothetical protein [Aureivirga marina]